MLSISRLVKNIKGEKETMKMKKFFKVGALASAMTLALTGCGSPKNELTEAYENLVTAKTYEVNTAMTISLEDYNLSDYELEQLLEGISTLTINAHSLVDNEKQQSENNLHFNLSLSPLDLSVDLSIFNDVNTGKSYVKVNDFLQIMNNIMPLAGVPFTFTLPEDIENSIVEMANAESPLTEEQAEKLSTDFQSKFTSLLEELPKSQFSKDDNEYKFTINGQKIETLFIDLIKDNMSTFELEEVTELEQLDEMNLIGDVVYITKIDNGKVVKEEMTIPITFNSETGDSIGLKLSVTSDYTNYDEPINFTFDIENSNLISDDEFLEHMTNNTMSDFGY